MENMLTRFGTGTIACVSDSYDIINAIYKIWGIKLRQRVLRRDGRLVIRPDSGDPVYTTLKVMEELWEAFGGEVNSKGYRVLHPKVRMIQGDGIGLESLREILQNFADHGYASENIAFGSGGQLLQRFDRDTCSFAFKCSSITVDGKERDVRKFPMEFDAEGNYVPSFKVSKSGRLGLVRHDDGSYETVAEGAEGDLLRTVFEDGVVVAEQDFADIRRRAEIIELEKA
jgi:nicotinamide phosphoribosyltransferase